MKPFDTVQLNGLNENDKPEFGPTLGVVEQVDPENGILVRFIDQRVTLKGERYGRNWYDRARLYPVTDLTSLPTWQLQGLKTTRYSVALELDIFTKLKLIATECGKDKDANHGPKYEFNIHNISLYSDCYGGYLTVHVGERRVCSTHDTERFINPGEWLDMLLAYLPEAENKARERETAFERETRAKLLAEVA